MMFTKDPVPIETKIKDKNRRSKIKEMQMPTETHTEVIQKHIKQSERGITYLKGRNYTQKHSGNPQALHSTQQKLTQKEAL